MCKSVIRTAAADTQRGYTLFIVLIMMLVIAFVVIANMQSNNAEMRISSNDADRKFAFANAESALASAEDRIVTVKHLGFSGTGSACVDGICQGDPTARTTPVWDKQGGILRPGAEAHCSSGASLEGNSCYVIEQMGRPIAGKAVYRVTSRSWGQNANTEVTLQAYVEYQE